MLPSAALGIALVLLGPSLSAQVPATVIEGPAPSLLFAAAPSPAGRFTLPSSVIDSIPETEWKRGLLIGAAVGGVGLGAFTYALCEGLIETDSSCLTYALGGAAVGATIGGVLGAFVGGQVPKRPAAAPDSVAAEQ